SHAPGRPITPSRLSSRRPRRVNLAKAILMISFFALFFGAELGESVSRGDFTGLEAIVVDAGVALVGKAGRLGGDLAHFGDHHLFVATALIGASRRRRLLNQEVEAACTQWHLRIEHMAELDHFAELDEL